MWCYCMLVDLVCLIVYYWLLVLGWLLVCCCIYNSVGCISFSCI